MNSPHAENRSARIRPFTISSTISRLSASESSLAKTLLRLVVSGFCMAVPFGALAQSSVFPPTQGVVVNTSPTTSRSAIGSDLPPLFTAPPYNILYSTSCQPFQAYGQAYNPSGGALLFANGDGSFTCDPSFQTRFGSNPYNGSEYQMIDGQAVPSFDFVANGGSTNLLIQDEQQNDILLQANSQAPNETDGLFGGTIRLYNASGNSNLYETIDLFGGNGNAFFAGGVTATTGLADSALNTPGYVVNDAFGNLGTVATIPWSAISGAPSGGVGGGSGGSLTQVISNYSSSGGYLGWNTLGMGESDFINNQGSQYGAFAFLTSANGSTTTLAMFMTATGNVGVGTTSPGADLSGTGYSLTAGGSVLEVNGDIALTQGKGGQVIYSDGTIQSTAWNGTTLGGDYAESVDVLGERDSYEPGDVIVIDSMQNGRFDKSDKPYSKLVAGVYSTKPGLVGRRTTTDRPSKETEVPMAMMGIVPTKVSTENGPIERGDLLVSSSTPGYAMKGTDANRMMGSVLGKALAPLKAGSGVIEVLIALQ